MKQVWSVGLRRLCLILCLALLLPCISLVGCSGTTEPPVYDNRLIFLSNSGVSIYRIVYPMEGCTSLVSEAATRLQDAMQYMLGVDVVLTSDRGTANAVDQLQPYEILIGETARTESQDVLPELRRDEYVIRVVGHKIVIVGESNRATAAGVDAFIANVLKYTEGVAAPADPKSEVKIEKNYTVKGKYECPKVPSQGDVATLPVALYQATRVNVVPAPDAMGDGITLATLQGLSTRYGSEQIFIAHEAEAHQLQAMADGGVTLVYHNDDDVPWSLGELLKYYAEHLYGYILCSSDWSDESAQVAINLANQLNAVVITPENEALAVAAGLSMVLDVRDKNDAWLRSSEYFPLLNCKIAVEPDAAHPLALIDYVAMTGCYYYDYCGGDEYSHVQTFKHMEAGGHILSATADDVHGKVFFDVIGVTHMTPPPECMNNLSVMSGWNPLWMQNTLFPEK